MIISTKSADTVLKRCLEKGQSSIIPANEMIEQFVVDPTMVTPIRDAYVITNEDISASRLKIKFEQAVAQKHPAVKIIFINKSSKPIYPNGLNGVDVILQKPKPNDAAQAISAILSTTTVHEVETPTIGTTQIPKYTTQDAVEADTIYHAPVAEEPLPTVPEPAVEEPEEIAPIFVPEEPKEEEAPVDLRSGMVERIKEASNVTDISIITREITATNLIKDLVQSNSTYAGIEEKLKNINDSIFTIMGNSNIKSLDEKLSKVRALLHDKAFLSAKGDTLIEQRLEEVIDLICRKTSELLKNRLAEIDTAIRRSTAMKDMEMNPVRLAGLNEERANIILELTTLETNILNIYKACDSIVMDTATTIGERAEDYTGNDKINMHIRARGGVVASDETVDAIRAALRVSEGEIPDTFKELRLLVINEVQLLRELFKLDAEVIAAQQEVINYLKSNNIEDTIIAETMLKKSLRVFVGEEGTGRTIIPYLLSKYKSRQNANVLCIDLTGESKYSYYGIQHHSLESYMQNLPQSEFTLVAGKAENSVSAAQNIVTSLIKSADYYRVINIVISPDQRELFHTIAQDVLCVNFLVDTTAPVINRMREVMEDFDVENVARRVIINKCDVAIRPIIDKLGLADKLEYQVCTIPNVPTITDAGLNEYDPYGISAVDLAMEETLKHA